MTDDCDGGDDGTVIVLLFMVFLMIMWRVVTASISYSTRQGFSTSCGMQDPGLRIDSFGFSVGCLSSHMGRVFRV